MVLISRRELSLSLFTNEHYIMFDPKDVNLGSINGINPCKGSVRMLIP